MTCAPLRLRPRPTNSQARPNEGAFPSAFDEQEQTHSRSALWVRDEPEWAPNLAFVGGHERQLFPRVDVRRRRAMIRPVSLTTCFHADSALLAEEDLRLLLRVAKALKYCHGDMDQIGELWNP